MILRRSCGERTAVRQARLVQPSRTMSAPRSGRRARGSRRKRMARRNAEPNSQGSGTGRGPSRMPITRSNATRKSGRFIRREAEERGIEASQISNSLKRFDLPHRLPGRICAEFDSIRQPRRLEQAEWMHLKFLGKGRKQTGTEGDLILIRKDGKEAHGIWRLANAMCEL